MNLRAHLLVVFVTVASVGFIVRMVRRRQLRAKYSLLWLSIGVALVALAITPTFLDTVSGWLGIYYAPATLFLGAITMLFLVVIHFSWELSRLEDRSRTLAEEVALLNARLAEAERRAAPPPPGADDSTPPAGSISAPRRPPGPG